MKGAAVLTAKAGDAICSLSDINCLVPRYVFRKIIFHELLMNGFSGRHELRFYPGFFDLHGKSYDYKIPYNQITRGFLLPHKDNRQMYFVVKRKKNKKSKIISFVCFSAQFGSTS